MIAGSILYLFMVGQDMGLAAEQMLNGLYNSWVLLAVPLFLLSAELMNIGSMSDRLLRFCDALVGRFRGGLGHINIVQSVIFAGMSGSAIADLAGTGRVIINMMTKDGKYTASYAAAITAANESSPSSILRFAKSTISTPLLCEMPIIMSTPIADWMFSDVPVIHNIQITPMSPRGAVTSMISGSIHDENCMTITR